MSLFTETTLILGSDGFLGRNFVRYFRERGWPTVCIGRADGDLTVWSIAERLLRDAPKVDRIIHLVTHQRTGQIQYGIQGELLFSNARIHLNVLEAWRLHQPQAKLISTGSSCAFPELPRAILEDDFQTGRMHESVRGYGLAKQLLAVGSETYASQYGLRYLHLFLATVYGPNDHKANERTHFMGGMIDRALKEKAAGSKEFTVWGAPDTVRDLLYIDDQIAAIIAADGAFQNQMLNCSSNRPVTIDSCARAILAALNWPAKIVYPSGTFRGADFKTIDSSTFLSSTHWVPEVELVDGVQRVIALDDVYSNCSIDMNITI